jgi:uncharacterized membrane protein (DUF373 family)
MVDMRPRSAEQERRERSWIAVLLGYGEFLLNTAVAFALGVGGVILLGVVLYDFVRNLGQGQFIGTVLSLLSGLLLVFIFTELISTLRVVIATRQVQVEPFLIVGIVAAIRRIIVISAEAGDMFGTALFRDVMLEIGVLTAAVLVLGVTVFMLRRAGVGIDDPDAERQPDRGAVESAGPDQAA